MNICIATGEYTPEPGGIATFYHNLAQLLTKHGHQVTVLTVSDGDDGDNPAVEVVRLPREARRLAQEIKALLRGAAPSAVRQVAAGLTLAAWLDANAARRAFDVIETPEFGGAGAFLTDLTLPPLAVTCHGSYGQMLFYQDRGISSPKHRILVGLEALLLGLADGVTAQSPANAQAWTDYLQREVVFVPAPWTEGVQVGAVNRERTNPSVVQGIVVGRLQSLKGSLEVVEALRICRQRGVPVRVTWVGRDTPTAPDGGSMLSYIQQHYSDVWETNFEWAERLNQTETRRSQAAADFALVPSQWETLGFTAIESMSVGTPLIISSGAGASYLVQDGVSGLITPPCDAPALADAIARLAGDAPLRLRLGCAGREVIRREFDPERVIGGRVAAYEAAIGRRAVRRERPFLAPASGLVTELIGLERSRAKLSPWRQPWRLVRALNRRWQRA